MSRLSVPESEAQSPGGYIFKHHAPKLGAALMNYSAAVYEHTSLSLREMEGARYRTALINGCIVCQRGRALRDFNTHNPGSGTAFDRPMHARGDHPDEDFYQAVPEWRTSALFSTRERLAIEFAERMGERPQSMAGDEEFWSKLKANFSDGEIVDLTLSVGSWMAVGRVSHILELDSVCSLPAPAWSRE